MTTTVTLTAPYQGAVTGQLIGLANSAATALIDADGGTLGPNDGVPSYPAGGYAGQAGSETTEQFLNRIPGGVPNPSSAVEGYQGQVVIVAGRNVPLSEDSWA